METPGEWIQSALSGNAFLALPAALFGGIIMGLNPCCIALFPAAAASCCASARNEPQRMSLSHAMYFVLGTAIAMMALGVFAALAGQTISAVGGWSRYVVALVPVVMGLQVLRVIRLPMPRFVSTWRGRGVAGAFLTGLLLALLIGPCGTPVLAAILSYAAFEGSLVFGALLLLAYGLGNAVPLLVVGTAAGSAARWLQRLGATRWIERASGIGLLGVGAYLIWGAS